MKYFDNSLCGCDVISSAICVLNQPQCLVDYDRYEKNRKRNYTVILKDLSSEAIITMANFSLHKHFNINGYLYTYMHLLIILYAKNDEFVFLSFVVLVNHSGRLIKRLVAIPNVILIISPGLLSFCCIVIIIKFSLFLQAYMVYYFFNSSLPPSLPEHTIKS